MSLKIQTHGGRCCGIKTIHGFGAGPTQRLGPKKAQKFNDCTDIYGHSVHRNYNWYRPKRPKETYLERFEEYIRYIKQYRPKGLIEVTMTNSQLDGTSYDYCNPTQYAWLPVLEKHGFKLVSKFKNSNTEGIVNVFHLVYGEKD